MIPKALFKKVKALEIKTRRLVNAFVSGQYQSAFKGAGVNFADVRPYALGDDVRFIDWKVTARTGGEPYIKLFEEERELTVYLLVDLSGSGHFGSGETTKLDIAAEIAAILGFSAIKNQDKVGLLLFTDKVEKVIPAQRGKYHIMRIIREIFYFKPEGRKTSISEALRYFLTIQKKRSVVFVISDFIDANYENELRMVARKHDVVPVVLEDERELELPKVGILALEDSETGEVHYLDSSNVEVNEAYRHMATARQLEQDRFFRSINLTSLRLSIQKPYINRLVEFFKRRARR